MSSEPRVKLSAVSTSLSKTDAKTVVEALPREILHNLQYQHDWTDLVLHTIDESDSPALAENLTPKKSIQSTRKRKTYLISGLPPRHTYIHPDFLSHLVLNKIEESEVQIQREWVLPMNTAETWTLQKFASTFDALPGREAREGKSGFKHQDVKRVVCAMKSHDGAGGDGTVVYYIMQEGEVKPRQN